MVKGQGHQAALLNAALTRKAAVCSGQRGNVFGVGKYCYIVSARRRESGEGHIVSPGAQLVSI